MDPAQSISWQATTHVHRDRSADWYWVLGIGTLLGSAVSIYFGNIMLAFILVVGVGSIAVLSARGPREHEVKIDRRGIVLDGTMYPYTSIHSFWVDVSEDEDGNPIDEGPEARLYLTTNALITPHLSIPLDSATHATSVREYLRNYLEEEEQRPHIGENIAEILGF